MLFQNVIKLLKRLFWLVQYAGAIGGINFPKVTELERTLVAGSGWAHI
jgi:hypothetical protein